MLAKYCNHKRIFRNIPKGRSFVMSHLPMNGLVPGILVPNKTFLKHYSIGVYCATISIYNYNVCCASTKRGNVFYCPFDSLIEPSVSESIRLISGEYNNFSDGKKGKSIILDNQQPQLEYISEKPFFTDSGSLEIWIKPISWKGI